MCFADLGFGDFGGPDLTDRVISNRGVFAVELKIFSVFEGHERNRIQGKLVDHESVEVHICRPEVDVVVPGQYFNGGVETLALFRHDADALGPVLGPNTQVQIALPPRPKPSLVKKAFREQNVAPNFRKLCHDIPYQLSQSLFILGCACI